MPNYDFKFSKYPYYFLRYLACTLNSAKYFDSSGHWFSYESRTPPVEVVKNYSDYIFLGEKIKKLYRGCGVVGGCGGWGWLVGVWCVGVGKIHGPLVRDSYIL